MGFSLDNSWDWTPDVWAWSPDQGRYQPKYGAPKAHVSLSLSTDAVRPAEAYDYWRFMAYYDFDADPRRPADSEGPFHASALALIAPFGEIYTYHSASVSGKRTERHIRSDDIDSFTIGLVLSGQRHHSGAKGTTLSSKPGDMFLYDATQASRIVWNAHRAVHLTLPRQVVASSLGSKCVPVTELAKALARSPLTPFLRSQMRLVARRGASLDQAGRALVFEQTVQLALAVLEQTTSELATRADREAYFVAAKRYIDAHLADPQLGVLGIAGALGCSRATLYRAFSERDVSLANYIKEARLSRAAQLLRKGAAPETLSKLAHDCGFTNADHFRREFRRRFGLSPSEFRMLHAAGPTPLWETVDLY